MFDLITTSPLLSGLVNHVWQTTIFTGIVALIVLAMRRNHARFRHAMWFAASVKFLVPFSLLVAIGNAIEWPGARPAFQPSANVVAFTQIIPAPVVESSHGESLALITWLAGLTWLAGFVIVTAAWFQAWRRARRAVRSADSGSRTRTESMEAVSELADLRFSASVTSPGVFGLVRPVLLLPADIEDRLTGNELAAVVAHELAHVRRRDNLTTAVHTMVTALFWFHPFVWWVGRQLITERERACDEAAVAGGFAPRGFAEALLKVCRSAVGARLECVAGIYGADLKTRIEGIMNYSKIHRPGPVLGATIALLAILVVVVPLAIGLTEPAPPPVELFAVQQTPEEDNQEVEVDGERRNIVNRALIERWLEEGVVYIVEETEREAFESLDTDEERERFIEQFWLRRDPTLGTIENEYRDEHYRRIAYANERFASDRPGWQTDRGRIYILHGEPDSRESVGRTATNVAYETWFYQVLEGIGGRVTIEFVDPDSSSEYRLAALPAEKFDLTEETGR